MKRQNILNNPIFLWVMGLLITSMNVHAGEDITITPAQSKMMGIVVAPLEAVSAVRSQHFPAQVVIPPASARMISAPQSGAVEELRVAVGETVRAGYAMARIRSPELVNLQGEFLQALTQASLAQSEFARDEQLFKDGIIAERRYITSKSRHEEQSAVLNQRRQGLHLAGMDDAAIRQLEKTRALSSLVTVVAPISGVVLERSVAVGQRVDRLDPLYRIAQLDVLWLEIRAPLEQVRGLTSGLRVEAPALSVTGRLILVGREVEPENQTVLLRAEVTQGAERLRPGQFVEAQLAMQDKRKNASGNTSAQQYSVPINAVARSGDKSVVFVQTAHGFRAQPVVVITEQNQRVVISGSLRGNERIAVNGVVAVKGAWLGLGGSGGH